MLQVRVIKDALENLQTINECKLRRWMEYFEELMNGENMSEREG